MSLKLEKVRDELLNAYDEGVLTFRRFRDPRDIGHAFTNLFVETIRAMPYTLGHIAALWVIVKLATGIWSLGARFLAWVF